MRKYLVISNDLINIDKNQISTDNNDTINIISAIQKKFEIYLYSRPSKLKNIFHISTDKKINRINLFDLFNFSKIDILIRGDYLAPIVFGKYEKINNYLPLPRKPFNSLIKYASLWGKVKVKEYDLVINAVEGSSSGRLLTKLSRAEYKVFGGTSEETPIGFKHRKHIALGPIYDLRYFLRNIREFNDKNIPLLDIKLTNEEKSKGKLALKKIVKTDKPVIGIFTFATGTKCYSTEFWDEFYTKLKAKFTAYQILEIFVCLLVYILIVKQIF